MLRRRRYMRENEKRAYDQRLEKEVAAMRVESKKMNARMWAVLTDISNQVCWYGKYLTKEAWKEIFTAELVGQKSVPGINGGTVFLSAQTSKMFLSEKTKLLNIAYAFGNKHGVKWSARKKERLHDSV